MQSKIIEYENADNWNPGFSLDLNHQCCNFVKILGGGGAKLEPIFSKSSEDDSEKRKMSHKVPYRQGYTKENWPFSGCLNYTGLS